MFSKMISLLVLILMTTSIVCQTSASICSFLSKHGRVRDLGLYRFISNGSISYRLFKRIKTKSDSEVSKNKSVEHQLVINNWNVSVHPSPIEAYYGLHKFYVVINKVSPRFRWYQNCRHIYTEQEVCLL